MSDNITPAELMEHASPLFSEQEIYTALDHMASRLRTLCGSDNPLILSVVIGGIVTTGHLATRLGFSCQLDYIHATRYQGEIKGKETLTWIAKPQASLKDRVVVLVDDVLDQGLTLQHLVDACYAEGASKVITCVLVDKTPCRTPNGLQHADVVGLSCSDAFIVGFGLDYQHDLRHLPSIYAVDTDSLAQAQNITTEHQS